VRDSTKLRITGIVPIPTTIFNAVNGGSARVDIDVAIGVRITIRVD
jgi:hypothetical protein